MTSARVDSSEQWEDKVKLDLPGGGCLQRRHTVIKFAKIPDHEPLTGRKPERKSKSLEARQEIKVVRSGCISPKPGKTLTTSQDPPRVSIVTKCEKVIENTATVKPGEHSKTSKVNLKKQDKKIINNEPIKLVSPNKNDFPKSPNNLAKSSPKMSEGPLKFTRCETKITADAKNKHNKEISNKKLPGKIQPKSPAKTVSYKLVKPKVDSNIVKKQSLVTKKNTEPPKLDHNSVKSKSNVCEKIVKNNSQVSMDLTNNKNNIPNTSHNVRPEMKNQTTETSSEYDVCTRKSIDTREIEIQTEIFNEITSTEQAPNLNSDNENALIPNNYENMKDIPNLKLPPFKISPRRKLKQLDDQPSSNSTNASIIIGKATVTYTRKKKINFQVLGTSETDQSSVSSTSSVRSPSYPCSVMNMLKRELDDTARPEKIHCSNNLCFKNVLCSCSDDIFGLQSKPSKKLKKPSVVIKKMQKKNILLNSKYFTEQFKRELNFIDSFFESLQYLENNCLTESTSKSISDRSNSLSDASDLQPYTLESESESRAVSQKRIDDKCNHRMTANRSLCLLNLLIREEQRRAKNLIFVLKMREDALKDFTKSQILYLENKKRCHEEDASTLKKKQRGALLKLQQQCGEMQRMKKALLVLSEQRQNALVTTKRNIELKMSNELEVNKLLMNRNKLQGLNNAKNIFTRTLFKNDCNVSVTDIDDTFSFSNEEIFKTASKKIKEISITTAPNQIFKVEKSIQTCSNINKETLVINNSMAFAELIKVDGAYLNILFQNIDLPELFTEGKNYEVNKKSLQNVLLSTDKMRESFVKKIVGFEENQSRSFSSKTNEAFNMEKSKHTCNNINRELIPVNKPIVTIDVVKVDGAYLNILFPNLNLPPMFTEGENYQVNRKALQNILLSTDKMQETLVQTIVTVEEDPSEKSLSKSSTPSTARSLVEEFDDYFNYLPKSESSSSSGNVESTTSKPTPQKHHTSNTSNVKEVKKDSRCVSSTTDVKENSIVTKENKPNDGKASTTKKSKSNDMSKVRKDLLPEPANVIKFDNFILSRSLSKVKKCDSSTNTDAPNVDKLVDGSEGKYSENNSTPTPSSGSKEIPTSRKRDTVIRTIENLKSSMNRPNKQDLSSCATGVNMLVEEQMLRSKQAASTAEEQELRKKQLAIELEIKALEQQFIVREIPDKPPPPYTPPAPGGETTTGTQTSAPPLDVLSTHERVVRAVSLYCDTLYPDVEEETASTLRPADSLEELVLDFCVDSIKKMKVEKSEEPWHPSKLLPPKLPTNKEKVKKSLTEEAFQILGLSEPLPMNTGPPILNKRCDYLDDILFCEWRKCEVEWTCLEANEINVQNQLFNTIYEKLLGESIEEFKSVLARKNAKKD